MGVGRLLIPDMWNPFKKKPEVRRALDLTGKPYRKANFFQRVIMNRIYKLIAPYLANWKTTLAGIPLFLGGVAILVNACVDIASGGSPTLETWQTGGASVLAGIAAIMGKDANKTGVAK